MITKKNGYYWKVRDFILVAAMLIIVAGNTITANAIVVHASETVESHNATLDKINIPGMGLLDPGGVVQIYNIQHPIYPNTAGTGVLLKGCRYVLTAAHIFEDPVQAYTDWDVFGWSMFFQNTRNEPGGTTATEIKFFSSPEHTGDISGPGESPIPDVKIHPLYVEVGNTVRAQPTTLNPSVYTSGPLAGYDVALIDLGTEFAATLQQENFPTYDLYVGNPLGQRFVAVGYGLTGTGDNGTRNAPGAQRYWGVNKFDAGNVPLPTSVTALGATGSAREETQLLFDFDDGPGDGDHDGLSALSPNFADPLNLPGESFVAPGDSGGPLFVLNGNKWQIAGVGSYYFRTNKDIDNELNSTYGEVAAAVNLNAKAQVDDPRTPEDDTKITIVDWIYKVTGIGARFNNSQGGALDNPNNWAYAELPASSMDASIQFDTDTPAYIDGPTGAFNVASLSMEGGQGYKGLFLENGGSLNMPGDFTIDTNNYVQFTYGSITADQLIVQGTTPVPVPPDAQRGTFYWYDPGYQATTLTVDRIVARPGGDFYYFVFDAGQLDANHLDIEDGGRAIVETDMTIHHSVTNVFQVCVNFANLLVLVGSRG